MFGFSLTKILFLVVVIAAIVYGFRWIERAGKTKRSRGDGAAAEETTECAVCGAYVTTAGASDCGRDDCPYG
ncbi:MAG: hypothetical protein ACTSRY_07530 [Alphaproteobacteria bacterium]